MNNLDKYIQNYDYRAGIMGEATDYCTSIFLRYMDPCGSILERGPAEGVMTEKLHSIYCDYTVVEGSKEFSELLKEKYPDMEVINSFFENFTPTRQYDYILLGHVLEHVDDPVYILKLCARWLTSDGKVLSAVPNAHSIHRQAAVLMGMLRYENELNDTDRGVGHQRVYNMKELQADFENAGLHIVKAGGYFLKPLSNFQMEKDWTPEMVKAFMKLGEEYPDIAGEIYIVAEK